MLTQVSSVEHKGKRSPSNESSLMIKYPIETIISCIIVGILSIFVIIYQLSSSSTGNFTSVLSAHVDLFENKTNDVYYFSKKIVISVPKYSSTKGILNSPNLITAKNFQEKMTTDFKTISGITFSDICFKLENGECFVASPFSDQSSEQNFDKFEKLENYLLDVKRNTEGGIIGASSFVLIFYFKISNQEELLALASWESKLLSIGTTIFDRKSKSLNSVQMLIQMFKVILY